MKLIIKMNDIGMKRENLAFFWKCWKENREEIVKKTAFWGFRKSDDKSHLFYRFKYRNFKNPAFLKSAFFQGVGRP